nr:myoinhibitory peptide:ISOTYPE=II [Manduca sexta]
GWQDLNSAW